MAPKSPKHKIKFWTSNEPITKPNKLLFWPFGDKTLTNTYELQIFSPRHKTLWRLDSSLGLPFVSVPQVTQGTKGSSLLGQVPQ